MTLGDKAWEDERESLLDHMAERHAAYLHASEWARRLALAAPQSGCHRAALDTAERANRAWIRAREAVEDHDYERDRPHIEAHARMVDDLLVDRALAWTDHVLGPGWLEEEGE